MRDSTQDPPQHLRHRGTFRNVGHMPNLPSEIEPDWVRSGTPVVRCDEHSSTMDGLAWTSVWDCTRSTFEWHYAFDEVVVILEGSVRVTDCHGNSHTLAAGDVGYFPYGSSWLWEVDDYVRKVAFCRHEVPRGLRLPTRVLRRLSRMFGGGTAAQAGDALARGWRRFSRFGRTATVMLLSIPL